MSNDEHDALVASVYVAAHEPGGWSSALGGLEQAFGLDAYVMLRYAGRHAAPELVCVGGSRVSAQADQKYSHYYQTIDPRARYARESCVDAMFLCDQHFDDAYVSRSEFYQDFLIPEGLRFCMGTCVRMSDGTDYLFGLQRGADRGPYGADVQQRFQRLFGHLGRSLRIYDRIGRQQVAAFAAEAALGTLPWAVLCLGDHGRYLGGNDLAESLLSDGVLARVDRRGLAFADHRTQEDFGRALRRCLDQRQPGAVLVRSSRDRAVRFTATLLPALPETPRPCWLPEPIGSVAGIRATCILAPLDRGCTLTVSQLVALFDLTPAEARLARATAAGVSLESYSSATGVAMSTLRSQLHVIFRKTDSDRQAELVRLLGRIPALPETGHAAAPGDPRREGA